ncbi:methyltransferase domain-containing protein [Streptomyces winkii]|uniref:methyltransferase domain-containing protein n=1 Tax=Streptomyces winkii TaxID=3051178 RepID=UPI0028D6BAD4|nr:methyltransferase domain-containing protein [Streptomyces sp. DSM 40971]
MTDATRSVLEGAESAALAEQFHGADGRAVRPCTPADVTRRHLRMLDVRPGARVLDIGAGSGLSAALLARLAGPEGQVTAVEIDAGLAGRAEGLYRAHGHRVAVVVGDGRLGHPPGAPYDRILAGTTPPAVPDAWLRQLAPGGVLLSGVRISDLPFGYAIARITVDERHRPHEVEVHHGGYMPMAGPERPDDVTHAADPERPERSVTLLGTHDPRVADSFLTALTGARHIEPSPAMEGDWYHLKNWLMAVEPDGLLEATLDRGNGIGIGVRGAGHPLAGHPMNASPDPDSPPERGSWTVGDRSAHAALVTGLHLVADHSGSPALARLRALIDRWRADGAPRTDRLRAELRPDGDVWHVRITARA